MNNLQEILRRSKAKGFKCFADECSYYTYNGKICNCSFVEVMGHNNCNFFNHADELGKEYKEPRKLNKREHGYCEYAERGWIARDEDGALYLYHNKPSKTINDTWTDPGEGIGNYDLINHKLFQFITWEDEEPYSVEEMLKWEVEE